MIITDNSIIWDLGKCAVYEVSGKDLKSTINNQLLINFNEVKFSKKKNYPNNPWNTRRRIIGFDNDFPVTWSEATSGSQFTIKFQDLPSWGHLLATRWLVWLDFQTIYFFQDFQVFWCNGWNQMERPWWLFHLPKKMLREITWQFSDRRLF